MKIIMFCVIILVFALLQFFIFNRAKNKLLKFLLLEIILFSLIMCLLIYINITGIESSSVIAENQVFAKFLSTICINALIGSSVGIILGKIIKK